MFVRGCDLDEVIVDGGESAKDLKRPGVERLIALVDAGKVDAVIVAKLDRLTSVPCSLADKPTRPLSAGDDPKNDLAGCALTPERITMTPTGG